MWVLHSLLFLVFLQVSSTVQFGGERICPIYLELKFSVFALYLQFVI